MTDKQQQALDKKAENARELGLHYEPAQQEPVACQYAQDVAMPEYRCIGRCQYNTSPPAQRTWVGLTDEDLYKVFPAIATYTEANKGLYRSIARVIEDALRSKNT